MCQVSMNPAINSSSALVRQVVHGKYERWHLSFICGVDMMPLIPIISSPLPSVHGLTVSWWVAFKACSTVVVHCYIYHIHSFRHALLSEQSIKKTRKYCHLAYLGRNFKGWHLVTTDGTMNDLDSSAFTLGHWRTCFRQVFGQIYLRYCRNYHGKCLELLFWWDLISITVLFYAYFGC